MNELLLRVSNANRSFEQAYVEWMKANEMGDPMPVLYPAFAPDELASLEEAAGAPLTDELKSLLGADGTRVGLGFGPAATEVLGVTFSWLDPGSIVEETRKLRDVAAEYDWELPPCVPFSTENSEPVAYRLDTKRMISVSAHDDGEVTELEMSLGEFLEKYAAAVDAQLAAGYGS